MLKRILYSILENYSSSYFLLYQAFSMSMVTLSVILALYDETVGLHKDVHKIIVNFEYFVSLLIAFEYIGRLYLSEKKLKYIFHPLSLLDLIAIIPYYQPFRFVRITVIIFRLLRVTVRYRRVIYAIFWVIKNVSLEFLFAFMILFVFIISSTFILFSIEKEAENPHINTVFDAFYMAIITALTVGYGDKVPVTVEGKVIAIIVGMGGLLLYSLLTATLSAGLMSYTNLLRTGQMSQRDHKNHIVICGWNETGKTILEHIISNNSLNKSVIVVSMQELDLPEWVSFRKGDFTKEEILKDVAVERAETVVILAERFDNLNEDSVDARSILTGLLVRDKNKKATVIMELLLKENAESIKRRRIADHIIVGGEIVGNFISHTIKNVQHANFLRSLLKHFEIHIIENEGYSRVEEAERNLEHKGLRVLGIIRGERIIYLPKLSQELKEGDMLIVANHNPSQ